MILCRWISKPIRFFFLHNCIFDTTTTTTERHSENSVAASSRASQLLSAIERQEIKKTNTIKQPKGSDRSCGSIWGIWRQRRRDPYRCTPSAKMRTERMCSSTSNSLNSERKGFKRNDVHTRTSISNGSKKSSSAKWYRWRYLYKHAPSQKESETADAKATTATQSIQAFQQKAKDTNLQ